MWMLSKQLEQMQLYMYAMQQQQQQQQPGYYGMPMGQPVSIAPIENPFKPEVNPTNGGGFAKGPAITSNPGFQMNPLSKQRRNKESK